MNQGKKAVIGCLIGAGGISLIAIINYLKDNIQKAKQEAKKKADPQYYEEKFKTYFFQFVQKYKEVDLKEQLEIKDQKKNVMFIGATSSGKTSLINNLFSTKLSKGKGSTTQKTALVLENQTFKIWDSVGVDSVFQILSIQKLKLLHSMKIIFILYDKTPKAIQFMIRVICSKTFYKVYFIRTFCDLFQSDDNKSVDQQLQQDYKLLKQYGVRNPIILKSSTKTNKFDNNRLYDMMKL